mmetsp:Transcript_37282/g.63456  ORF Transcript_37282/g.63456 Transcript_37282/m.63456 type:complete len:739 (+) Transcript_37282:361-2577(+)
MGRQTSTTQVARACSNKIIMIPRASSIYLLLNTILSFAFFTTGFTSNPYFFQRKRSILDHNWEGTTTLDDDGRTPTPKHNKKFQRSSSILLRAKKGGGSGGRAAGTADKVIPSSSSDEEGQHWEPTPCEPGEARLTIIQITDTYTLEHLASVKTLLADIRSKSVGSKVISMMTGDFLAPYLLSSVDRGKGMMNALSKIPIDYLTWGNHEADLAHKIVCKRVRDFPGIWLNSNMLDHEAMDAQQEYDVIEVTSPDGSNVRNVGLVAVLSDDPELYSHFKPPGPFGGATIDCPWKTLGRLKATLEGPEYNCDVVVPLQHTYVPDDHRTCRDFDFPVMLSGHDHHRVDEVVAGTRLLKPGMDAVYATVLELSWSDTSDNNDNNAETSCEPRIRARFVKTSDWEPEPELAEENERAYDALAPLRNTELARVPSSFEPLSSVNSRGKVCSMGTYICSLLRSSLNTTRRQRKHDVDAVLLMGGTIRGSTDYPTGSFFSLEALESEVKGDEVIAVVPMPGWLLADGIAATHAGDPTPGWMQYDNGIQEEWSDVVGALPVITHVKGEPIEPERVYRVATKIRDLTNGQSPPWTEYYNKHPELLPPKGQYVNIHAELMAYFAKNLWRKIWESLSEAIGSENECAVEDAMAMSADGEDCCDAEMRMAALDKDGDGVVSAEEIQEALGNIVGLSIDNRELTLAKFVRQFADITGSGEVTLDDLQKFCDEIEEIYDNDAWRLSFPRVGEL